MPPPFSINPKYCTTDFQKLFLEAFSSPEKTIDDDGELKIIHSPFTCAVLPNFLETTVLDDLEVEARKFPFNRRQNDLFSFNQSDDLKTLNKNGELAKRFNLLSNLRQFFATDMLKWMKDITGIDLDEGEVNSTVSLYEPHDYLLCHDDELERRRIAFIIYLVPEEWDSSVDGGSLDLFESGPTPDCTAVPGECEAYHPWRVVRSIPPARNCLAFFEVCARSFHQVAEVIGRRDRLSIHGWYMSDPLPRVHCSRDPLRVPRIPPCFIEEGLVYKWINPVYIDMEQQKAILRRFRSTSEIRLPQFFVEREWEKLCKALDCIENQLWTQEGPMNLRNTSVLSHKVEDATLPEECRQVRRLWQSEAMLVILSQMTGVLLHPLASLTRSEDKDQDELDGAEASASIKTKRARLDDTDGLGEPAELTSALFHRWSSGMYTLLADANSGVVPVPSTVGDDVAWRLDLFYHISGYGSHSGCGPTSSSGGGGDKACWQPSWNGQIVYVSLTDNEELLRITPNDNSLTLVYCDSDCASFVRYLNAKAKPLPAPGGGSGRDANHQQLYAYDVSLTYFDPSPNDGQPDEELSVVSCEETEEEEEEGTGASEGSESNEPNGENRAN
ncbi:unnamed protein product [Mesocestoides corti]|uniref:uS12 prolyl 3-hydroxylase n=1 Tax=Mesocestoides corti TaxID=53468 RepID=A0A0R3U9S4_MESCO|nr:unnamed protein product [Mesocestoides corti]